MKKLILLIFILFSAHTFGQVPSYVPTNGLVGYWPFNGNANDESGNGNDGVVNGATLTNDNLNNPNSAYHFDGSGQFIEILHSSSLTFSANAISISFKVKVEGFPSGNFSNVMISKQSGSGNTQSGFNVAQSGSNAITNLNSVGGGDFGGASVLSDTSNFNSFHSVVFIYDNGTATSYLDGTLSQTFSSQTATIGANNVPLLFGKANWSNINATPFNGVLDDIGIWNRSLTSQEITNLHTGSLPTTCAGSNLPIGLANGLVAWYPFCGNANDESGNGHNGVVNGAVLTNDRFGNTNSAYEFNGINSNIQTANSTSLSIMGDFTLSAWKFEYAGSSDYNSIVTKRLGGNWSYNIAISKISGGSGQELNKIMTGRRNNNGAQTEYKFSNDSTIEGMWQHVLVTVANDTATFYINGQNAGYTLLGNVFSIPMIDQTVGLTIGDCNCGLNEFMNGKLDDIGIWNRALTQQEITSLYNTGICFQTVTVTDTLIINANITGFNPITYQNTIKVYPNPSNDHITIDCGANYNTLNGYSLRIDNLLSQTVYITSITQQSYFIDLNTWTGNGVYLIYLINDQGIPIDVRKIVIQ